MAARGPSSNRRARLLRRDQHCRRAVGDLARISRRHHPPDFGEARRGLSVDERRLQRGQLLGARGAADALVRRKLRRWAEYRARRGLGPRPPLHAGANGARRRRVLARERPAGGDQLGGDPLVHEARGIAPAQHRPEIVLAEPVAAHGHAAHHLDTAGDGEVVGARHHAWAAKSMACCAEPHLRSMVTAGTVPESPRRAMLGGRYSPLARRPV